MLNLAAITVRLDHSIAPGTMTLLLQVPAGAAGAFAFPHEPVSAASVTREAAPPPSGASGGPTPGYSASVQAWLISHKRYPDDARVAGDEGNALIRFTVDRDGRVLAHSIVKSKGSPRLDRALNQMLENADTLPPFPPEMTRPQIEITVTVHYTLR